ncbi:MAG TPA: LacI family DNA-binding transcriptional regulator [Mycobacteriales bacterium]|nr:LacI family DNA-binding transcriptional regulator [Mycobacteriales bacterium]
MSSEPAGRRPTIRQVAALAGVSHQTVSRYLRHTGGLRDSTVASIESAITQLGYQPDLAARSMRTGRADTLALVLPGLPRGNVYHRELTAACAAAHEAGFRTEIVLAEGGAEGRSEFIRSLLAGGRVDGALSLAPIAPRYLKSDHRVVAAAELDDDMRNIGALADGSTAGAIVEYLAELGHCHFLHIAGDRDYASARDRAAAYAEAIERLGLHSHGVVGHSWSAEAGYRAIDELPADSPVTAIITAHDATAGGAVRAAYERKWAVPERLSIFGWGDQTVSRYSIPTLSTVAVNREMRGRYVMEQLIAAVRREPAPAAPREPLNTLLFRESTSAPGEPAERRKSNEATPRASMR